MAPALQIEQTHAYKLVVSRSKRDVIASMTADLWLIVSYCPARTQRHASLTLVQPSSSHPRFSRVGVCEVLLAVRSMETLGCRVQRAQGTSPQQILPQTGVLLQFPWPKKIEFSVVAYFIRKRNVPHPDAGIIAEYSPGCPAWDSRMNRRACPPQMPKISLSH